MTPKKSIQRGKSPEKPSAVEQFVGQTFSEAFTKYVLGNPELRELAAAIPYGSRQYEPRTFSDTIQKKWFPGTTRPLWPVQFESQDFTKLMPAYYLGRDKRVPQVLSSEFVSAAGILRSRYAELIEALREGKLIGFGFSLDQEKRIPIPREFWKQYNCWIDVNTGEFREVNPKRMLWQLVTLELPSTVIRPQDGSGPGKKGGRPQKFAWDEALDRVIVKIGKKGLPDSQTELISLFTEAFHEMRSDQPDESTIRERMQERIPITLDAIKGA